MPSLRAKLDKYFKVNFAKMLEFKTIAYECVHASRSRFNGIFNFLCDEEYREVYEAKRNFGTLGAEKLKIT